MEGITDYRHRLDKTLTSPHLTNHNLLHTLVKNQILHSSNVQLQECEDLVHRRSKEVFDFLGVLRSASENDSERSKSIDESRGGWKVKQDTEDLRVMYREGLDGTPFHTLLAEGYVNGPVDVCLCVSFQSELYKEWWPQTSIPTFKVDSSQRLKTVRIGEQISLVRIKVSWPLSSREVLLHYFVFEYFQDGLVVVVFNSISDSETLEKRNHGFTRDGLPYAQDVVRMDVSGGFAIQKVTAERSFFRTIATMDIKVDFIPPAFINFLARQVIGSGFKLYKKVVASVSKGDIIYAKALREPLYAHMREALYSESKSTVLKQESLDDIAENEGKTYHTNQSTEEENIHKEITQKLKAAESKVGVSTAVEIINDSSGNFRNEAKKKVGISSEVEQALDMLEKIISVFREYNINPSNVYSGGRTENGYVEEFLSSQANDMTSENKKCADSAKLESTKMISNEPRNNYASRSSSNTESNSYLRETNQCKIPVFSADGILCSSPSQTGNSSKYSTISEIVDTRQSTDANGMPEDVMAKRKHRKPSWFECLYFNSGQ